MKRNPREVRWTVLYRRKHRKGMQEEAAKRRTRRTVRYQKPIAGTSLSDIIAKRTQRPEIRKAQRDAAIKCETTLPITLHVQNSEERRAHNDPICKRHTCLAN